MKINNISPYIVDAETKLEIALRKLNANQHKIVFVTDLVGKLVGSLSDGDFRRWLLDGNQYEANTNVYKVCNTDVKYINFGMASYVNASDFTNGKKVLPIVDEYNHIVSLVAQDGIGFAIGNHDITNSSPPFIIAEIGNNHQGDIHTAKELVLYARDAGVQSVKFQMRSMEILYGSSSEAKKISEDLGSQYTLDLLQKFQLTDEELFEIFDFSTANGLIPLCTPWDVKSLEKLESYGMAAYKVASADFTNHELIERIASTGKPMLCSTGMSTEEEIISTVQFLERKNADFLLLHCNSTYPTPYKDIQLNYLKKLEQISKRMVGYSGHERGIHVALAACALGAKVIEKHITLDREQEGTDHKVSLLPNELQEMCRLLLEVHAAMGSQVFERKLTQGELINRQTLAKSIYVNRLILKNDIIQRKDLTIRGPGKGLQPNMIEKVVGIRANRNIECDTELFASDLTEAVTKRSRYQISRPHGIPVRYHDYSRLTSGVELDFVEFHLSYGDLRLDPADFLPEKSELGFAVHCPELFENDHLLDLTSPNDIYRKKSIGYLKQTIETTIHLKPFFQTTEKPTLIVNVGGWSKHGFLEDAIKMQRYDLLKRSLNEIQLSEINLAIQTMPPFPWHFGGQSHHNLFVDPEEIKNFCAEFKKVSICLDTSHSMMACNYYGWDFLEFVKSVAPSISYLHLADAQGVDGEGVAFGKGDINFTEIWKFLRQSVPSAPFIPEVWQGHVNEGAEFWNALSFVENLDAS